MTVNNSSSMANGIVHHVNLFNLAKIFG